MAKAKEKNIMDECLGLDYYDCLSKIDLALESTKNSKYNKLSKNVKKVNNKGIDSRLGEKLDKKLYRLFLNLIDEQSAYTIVDLDYKINALRERISISTGWDVSEFFAIFKDNFRTTGAYEMNSCDTYMISRDPDTGFFLSGKKNGYTGRPKRIREREKKFYKLYKSELSELHNMWAEKERIMCGEYELKNPTNENVVLASNISLYLGYSMKGQAHKNPIHRM